MRAVLSYRIIQACHTTLYELLLVCTQRVLRRYHTVCITFSVRVLLHECCNMRPGVTIALLSMCAGACTGLYRHGVSLKSHTFSAHPRVGAVESRVRSASKPDSGIRGVKRCSSQIS